MRKLIRITYDGFIYDVRIRKRLPVENGGFQPLQRVITFLSLTEHLELGAEFMDLEKGKNGSVFGIVNRLFLDLSQSKVLLVG